jgi:hypothetical protein
MNESYNSAFEHRVSILRKKLKEELFKKKHDRSKKTIKHIITELRKWEAIIKKNKKISKCPHCNGEL